MRKPFGSVSLSSWNLSAASGIGGGATGASFLALSLSGWPIAQDGGGDGGADGCWASAGAAASMLPIAPAVSRRKERAENVMNTSQNADAPFLDAGRARGTGIGSHPSGGSLGIFA